MTKKTPRKKDVIVYLSIAVMLVMIIYYVSVSDLFEDNSNEKTYVHDVELSISAPNWAVSYTAENTSNITVADFLIEWANNEQISIEKQYFSGYNSFLIESIGNYTNGNQDYYWQYYVNKNYAEIGCSDYVLADNDTILWSFEPSQQS